MSKPTNFERPRPELDSSVRDLLASIHVNATATRLAAATLETRLLVRPVDEARMMMLEHIAIATNVLRRRLEDLLYRTRTPVE